MVKKADLREFVSVVQVERANVVDGHVELAEGAVVPVKLTFAEKTDLQFADEPELTYALPEGFSANADAKRCSVVACKSPLKMALRRQLVTSGPTNVPEVRRGRQTGRPMTLRLTMGS